MDIKNKLLIWFIVAIVAVATICFIKHEIKNKDSLFDKYIMPKIPNQR